MGMGMGVGMGTGADADAGIYIIRLLPSPLLPSVSSSRVSDSESESAALTERSLGCSGTPVLWWLDTINSYTHRSQMVSGRMRRWPHPFAGQNGKVRLRMMPSNHWAVGIGHWAPEFKTHRRGIVQATKDDGQPHPKTKNQANKKKKIRTNRKPAKLRLLLLICFGMGVWLAFGFWVSNVSTAKSRCSGSGREWV